MYGNRDGGFQGPQRSTAPVNVGDELDVRIEAVGEKGDGIAKKDGFVLFVPNVKEGDQVRIRVTRVLRKVGFAEVVGSARKSTKPTGQEESEEPEEEELSEDELEAKASEDFGEESDEDVPEETEEKEKKAPADEEDEAVEEDLDEDMDEADEKLDDDNKKKKKKNDDDEEEIEDMLEGEDEKA
jgi:predicted RNA-binding protein with TRAM domain